MLLRCYRSPAVLSRADRSEMGLVESGHLHLHPLCRHPPEPRGPHLQGQVGQSGPVDPGTGPGTSLQTRVSIRVRVRVGLPLWFVAFQCVQEMGNAKAKRLYEAFLPECFQRPETDQSAEIFIRDKYDKKKYMDKVIDIQMLRVSLRTRSVDLQERCVAQQDSCFYSHRKKRAATTYPRSQLYLKR